MDVADIQEVAIRSEHAPHRSGFLHGDVGRGAGDLRREANIVSVAIRAAGEAPFDRVVRGDLKTDSGNERIADGVDLVRLARGFWSAAVVRSAGGDSEQRGETDEKTHGGGSMKK